MAIAQIRLKTTPCDNHDCHTLDDDLSHDSDDHIMDQRHMVKRNLDYLFHRRIVAPDMKR